MKAWLLYNTSNLAVERLPLRLEEVPVPTPANNEVLISIRCCGVCHTELDEIEGRTAPPAFPVVPGHQVVGVVTQTGSDVTRLKVGDRVGVAWIYSSCGRCTYCIRGFENLCADFKATGRDAHGGYCEFMVIREDYAYKIPDSLSDAEAAPMLCAGAIGYRSLRLTRLTDGQTIGLTGFGASGHLVLKMVKLKFPKSKILVFARSKEEQQFAKALGAYWAGHTEEDAPVKAYAIIDTTPVWKPVVSALRNLEPGGRLVINAIRKEEADKQALLELQYAEHLWMEKEITSVTNITAQDVIEFLDFAAASDIKPEIEIYSMLNANQALLDLKHKHIKGAKVLQW